MKVICASVPEEMYERIKEMHDKHGLNISYWLRELIKKDMEKNGPV